MSSVKSWDVQLSYHYYKATDSQNKVQLSFEARGLIANEVMPAGSRMIWPQLSDPNPEHTKIVRARGMYRKMVNNHLPAAQTIEN